jgi:hypothetical protein
MKITFEEAIGMFDRFIEKELNIDIRENPFNYEYQLNKWCNEQGIEIIDLDEPEEDIIADYEC